APPADDRALAHAGPAREEEEDHQQREEQLDQQVWRRRGEQPQHGVRLLDRDSPRVARLAQLDLIGDSAHEPIEVLVKVEYRLQGRTDLRDLARDLRDPVGGRNQNRPDGEQGESQEDQHAQTGRKPRGDSSPLEPFEQRNEGDRDNQRRGYRHEEFGAELKRERKTDDQADSSDQGQRREQPVALGGYRFRQHAGFVDRLVVGLPM